MRFYFIVFLFCAPRWCGSQMQQSFGILYIRVDKQKYTRAFGVIVQFLRMNTREKNL